MKAVLSVAEGRCGWRASGGIIVSSRREGICGGGD
jgi:hypothetical protein